MHFKQNFLFLEKKMVEIRFFLHIEMEISNNVFFLQNLVTLSKI